MAFQRRAAPSKSNRSDVFDFNGNGFLQRLCETMRCRSVALPCTALTVAVSSIDDCSDLLNRQHHRRNLRHCRLQEKFFLVSILGAQPPLEFAKASRTHETRSIVCPISIVILTNELAFSVDWSLIQQCRLYEGIPFCVSRTKINYTHPFGCNAIGLILPFRTRK